MCPALAAFPPTLNSGSVPVVPEFEREGLSPSNSILSSVTVAPLVTRMTEPKPEVALKSSPPLNTTNPLATVIVPDTLTVPFTTIVTGLSLLCPPLMVTPEEETVSPLSHVIDAVIVPLCSVAA
jgi:hypothetical protein